MYIENSQPEEHEGIGAFPDSYIAEFPSEFNNPEDGGNNKKAHSPNLTGNRTRLIAAAILATGGMYFLAGCGNSEQSTPTKTPTEQPAKPRTTPTPHSQKNTEVTIPTLTPTLGALLNRTIGDDDDTVTGTCAFDYNQEHATSDVMGNAEITTLEKHPQIQEWLDQSGLTPMTTGCGYAILYFQDEKDPVFVSVDSEAYRLIVDSGAQFSQLIFGNEGSADKQTYMILLSAQPSKENSEKDTTFYGDTEIRINVAKGIKSPEIEVTVTLANEAVIKDRVPNPGNPAMTVVDLLYTHTHPKIHGNGKQIQSITVSPAPE